VLTNDILHPLLQVLVPMLEGGVRVMIYAGDVDFICNWYVPVVALQLRSAGRSS
jgi:hypothetical protein